MVTFLRLVESDNRTYSSWCEQIQSWWRQGGWHCHFIGLDGAKALIKLALEGLGCVSVADLFHALRARAPAPRQCPWPPVQPAEKTTAEISRAIGENNRTGQESRTSGETRTASCAWLGVRPEDLSPGANSHHPRDSSVQPHHRGLATVPGALNQSLFSPRTAAFSGDALRHQQVVPLTVSKNKFPHLLKAFMLGGAGSAKRSTPKPMRSKYNSGCWNAYYLGPIGINKQTKLNIANSKKPIGQLPPLPQTG